MRVLRSPTRISAKKSVIAAILIASLVVPLTGATVYAAPATKSNPANSKSGAKCGGNQTATQIDSGPDKNKWYCKDNQQAGVGGGQSVQGNGRTGRTCGGPDSNYYTPSIDIGCRGQGNPIADALFGIIRFLSAGVGLIIIGSIIVGGMQYTGSRGDPQATAMAVNRIRSSVFALIIYLFAFAILNYIIPAGFLNQ